MAEDIGIELLDATSFLFPKGYVLGNIDEADANNNVSMWLTFLQGLTSTDGIGTMDDLKEVITQLKALQALLQLPPNQRPAAEVTAVIQNLAGLAKSLGDPNANPNEPGITPMERKRRVKKRDLSDLGMSMV